MRLDGGTLGHYCLRTLLGELGDKTFFLTAAFAAWCPWEGIRDHDDRLLQMVLVFLGSFVALSLRAIFLVSITEPPYWSAVCEGFSCVLLLLLGIKAKVELSRVEAATPRHSSAASAAADVRIRFKLDDPEAEASQAQQPQWNRDAFSSMPPLAPPPQAETDYGTLKPLTSADGVFAERISDRVVSSLLAFAVPLFVVYFAEAEDKSSSAISVHSAAHHAEVVVGAILGGFIAVTLAVFFGFLLERQLLNQRLLFTTSAIFFVVSLISLSQALLHLSAARPDEPVSSATAKQALLSIYRSVHRGVVTLGF